MKLSEIKGERAVEVIADLIEPIANIAHDYQNFRVADDYRKEGESDQEVAIRAFKEKIPDVMKTHKQDFLNILCTINDTSREELSVMDIITGVINLANDKDFMSLFLSAVNLEERTQPTEFSQTAKHTKQK